MQRRLAPQPGLQAPRDDPGSPRTDLAASAFERQRLPCECRCVSSLQKIGTMGLQVEDFRVGNILVECNQVGAAGARVAPRAGCVTGVHCE